jgi:hypothetical protein
MTQTIRIEFLMQQVLTLANIFNSVWVLPCGAYVISNLVSQCNGSSYGKGKKGKGHSSSSSNANLQANTASIAGTGSSTDTATGGASKPAIQETTRVASTFLYCDSHIADVWLCDSGASSSMSNDHSTFSTLRLAQHPIHLADGKLIYSKGVGSIKFLSDCGYLVTIHNVLFILPLMVNLFAANSFMREHHDTHSEVMEYPKHRWINRGTGAIEFTMTIQNNSLPYLDWGVTPGIESANLSIMELHACLNYMPFLAIGQHV